MENEASCQKLMLYLKKKGNSNMFTIAQAVPYMCGTNTYIHIRKSKKGTRVATSKKTLSKAAKHDDD